jgi:hypothetical protein
MTAASSLRLRLTASSCRPLAKKHSRSVKQSTRGECSKARKEAWRLQWLSSVDSSSSERSCFQPSLQAEKQPVASSQNNALAPHIIILNYT